MVDTDVITSVRAGNPSSFTLLGPMQYANGAASITGGLTEIAYGTFSISGAPAAPTLSSAIGGTGEVSLTWTVSSGATSYTILRSTTTGTETSLDTGILTLSYVDITVASGITYYYTIEAVNGNGTSAQSNELSVTPS